MLKKKANAAKANDSQVGGEPLEPPSTNPFTKSPATHKLVFSIIHRNFKLQIYVQNMDPFFDTSSPHLLNSPCFFSFSPPILLFLPPKKTPPNPKFQPSIEKKNRITPPMHLNCLLSSPKPIFSAWIFSLFWRTVFRPYFSCYFPLLFYDLSFGFSHAPSLHLSSLYICMIFRSFTLTKFQVHFSHNNFSPKIVS